MKAQLFPPTPQSPLPVIPAVSPPRHPRSPLGGDPVRYHVPAYTMDSRQKDYGNDDNLFLLSTHLYDEPAQLSACLFRRAIKFLFCSCSTTQYTWCYTSSGALRLFTPHTFPAQSKNTRSIHKTVRSGKKYHRSLLTLSSP